MTEFESMVVEQLSEIKSTGAATHASMESLVNRLFEPGSGVITNIQTNIKEIKDARIEEAKDTKRDNIIHYVLGPSLVIIHAILHHFGIKV